jgi:hydroxyacylglutathione hydrolase
LSILPSRRRIPAACALKAVEERSVVFVKQFRVGGDRNFAYLIGDDESRLAIVVDPSFSPTAIVEDARDRGFQIAYGFCTHDHWDHTNGNTQFEKETKLRPLLYGGRDPKTGILVQDGATFPLGTLSVRVLHTPGHTSDSICLHVGDAVFTGDTLFVGKVGGTGFGEDARQEYESLHDKLMTLPLDTRVFPGHDYGVAPESTIRHERKTNPFLLRPDFESFVQLKRNWDQYKKEHGIA